MATRDTNLVIKKNDDGSVNPLGRHETLNHNLVSLLEAREVQKFKFLKF